MSNLGIMIGPHKIIDKTTPQDVKPNIFLEDMATKVKQLTPSELRNALKDEPDGFKYFFQPDRSFGIKGRIYGVNCLEGVEQHDPKVLKAFIYHLDIATERLLSILESSSNPNSSKRLLRRVPLNITNDDSMLWSGLRINCGKNYLDEFAKNLGHGNYLTVVAELEADFFHELIHVSRGLSANPLSESLSLLGELLYDPKNNSRFVGLANKLTDEVDSGRYLHEPVFWGKYEANDHIRSWKVVAEILLWEYKQLHPNFSVPKSRADQIKLLYELPSRFAEFSQEQRDAILKEYFRKDDVQIERIASDNGKKLNLKF
jgi:hypothetical protein